MTNSTELTNLTRTQWQIIQEPTRTQNADFFFSNFFFEMVGNFFCIGRTFPLFFSTLDANKDTYTHLKFNNGSRTMNKFKNQTRTKNEKSEKEKWKIDKSNKKKLKLWYQLMRSSLEERVWSDRFLVGLHRPDRNPVRDSVRLLELMPERFRNIRW